MAEKLCYFIVLSVVRFVFAWKYATVYLSAVIKNMSPAICPSPMAKNFNVSHRVNAMALLFRHKDYYLSPNNFPTNTQHLFSLNSILLLKNVREKVPNTDIYLKIQSNEWIAALSIVNKSVNRNKKDNLL